MSQALAECLTKRSAKSKSEVRRVGGAKQF